MQQKKITPKGSPFFVLDVSGDDYEIGEGIGRAIKMDIADMWENFTLPRMIKWYGTPPEDYDKTYTWLRGNLERHCPWMAEQMDGIAAGSGLSAQNIWFMNHYSLLWSACGVFCTSMAVGQSDAGPVLIQNLDIGDEDFYYVLRIRPDSGYATLSDAMCAMCWSPTGINEKGLAVGSSNLGSIARVPNKPLAGGIANTFLPRMVLRQCGSTREAVEYLKSLPPVCPETAGYQLNLVDSNGEMAVVDKSGPHTLVRQCEPGMNFTTNFSLDKNLEAWRAEGATEEQKRNQRNFYDRADKIRSEYRKLDGQTPTVKWMKDLFRSHEGKGRVCRHGPECNGGYSRLGFVYYPKECRAEICNGIPCENEYQSFSLEKR